MKTFFISDLHLDPSRPIINQIFLDFLEHDAIHADALYILGDFFEAWIGDDDENELATQVIKGLRQLHDRGIPIYIMQGNRDFLLSERFCEASGCILLKDPTAIKLYGKTVLLMHGDSLCTHDRTYMRIRPIIRARWFKWVLYRLSLAFRRRLAQKARAKSKRSNREKSPMIMDVNLEAVRAAMNEYHAEVLIHGHTHQPAIHYLSLQEPKLRIVLSDWYESGHVFSYEESGEHKLIYIKKK